MRLGYVPEHFLTPVLLAHKHGFFKANGLHVELVPQPSGTGQMISSYKDKSIDVAIGLTEGWVNGYSGTYRIIATYVKSPLCWAISGRKNGSLDDVKKIGVSRMGSGSHVMATLLSKQRGTTYEYILCNTFQKLRESVNDGTIDAFMWEFFTTKKYFDSGEVSQIGEMYTPWPSWCVTASNDVSDQQVNALLKGIKSGIEYYHAHRDESMTVITTLGYTLQDAQEWSKTVEFSDDLSVDKGVISRTIEALKSAGLPESSMDVVRDPVLKL